MITLLLCVQTGLVYDIFLKDSGHVTVVDRGGLVHEIFFSVCKSVGRFYNVLRA